MQMASLNRRMPEDVPGGYIRAIVPAGTIIVEISPRLYRYWNGLPLPAGGSDTAQIVAFLAETYLI